MNVGPSAAWERFFQQRQHWIPHVVAAALTVLFFTLFATLFSIKPRTNTLVDLPHGSATMLSSADYALLPGTTGRAIFTAADGAASYITPSHKPAGLYTLSPGISYAHERAAFAPLRRFEPADTAINLALSSWFLPVFDAEHMIRQRVGHYPQLHLSNGATLPLHAVLTLDSPFSPTPATFLIEKNRANAFARIRIVRFSSTPENDQRVARYLQRRGDAILKQYQLDSLNATLYYQPETPLLIRPKE